MGDDLTDTDRDKSFQQMLASFLRDDLAPAGPDCLAPGAAAAYYAGALSEAEARAVEAHLAACGACQAEIALLARLEAGGQVEPRRRKQRPTPGALRPTTSPSGESRRADSADRSAAEPFGSRPRARPGPQSPSSFATRSRRPRARRRSAMTLPSPSATTRGGSRADAAHAGVGSEPLR